MDTYMDAYTDRVQICRIVLARRQDKRQEAQLVRHPSRVEVLGIHLQQRLPLLLAVAVHIDHAAGVGQRGVLGGANGG